MKKFLALVLVMIVVSTVFVSCSKSKTDSGENAGGNSESQTTEKKKLTKMTAEELINALKATIPSINNVIVYNAETDPNELLGKPKQYTGKVNFADTRIEQYDLADPLGGSVEVFENSSDAKGRKEYLDMFASAAPLAEYTYIYNNVLLRVSISLSLEQAKEYETEFTALQ